MKIKTSPLRLIKRPENFLNIKSISCTERGLHIIESQAYTDVERSISGQSERIEFLFANDYVSILLTNKYFDSILNVNGIVLGCESIEVYLINEFTMQGYTFDVFGIQPTFMVNI